MRKSLERYGLLLLMLLLQMHVSDSGPGGSMQSLVIAHKAIMAAYSCWLDRRGCCPPGQIVGQSILAQ
jgi:hypothetical protein